MKISKISIITSLLLTVTSGSLAGCVGFPVFMKFFDVPFGDVTIMFAIVTLITPLMCLLGYTLCMITDDSFGHSDLNRRFRRCLVIIFSTTSYTMILSFESIYRSFDNLTGNELLALIGIVGILASLFLFGLEFSDIVEKIKSRRRDKLFLLS